MSNENDLNITDITLGNLTNPQSTILSSTGEEKPSTEENVTEAEPNITEQPPVEESNEATTVEADTDESSESIQLNVDDEGNLINATGDVLYKKGEFEVVQNEDGTQEVEVGAEEDTAVLRNLIKDNYGIDLSDRDGNAITYENNQEGLVKMIADASEHRAYQMEQQTFAAYPEAKALLNHLAAGYDSSSFFNVPSNYSNIFIPEETNENKQNLKPLYRDLILGEYKERYDYNNLTVNQQHEVDKQANAWYVYQEQAGMDRDSAITAQKLLATKEQQAQTQRDQRNQQVIQQREQEEQVYWDGVKSAVVDNGQLGNLKIPVDVRENFYDYISRGVNEHGHTQEYIDASQTTEDNVTLNMQLALLRYLKFDVNKLIKMEVANDKVRDLKLLNNKRRIKVSGGLPITKTSNDITGINIGNLHGKKKR
tara:strand:- start:146 stop:1420 length:1275 start_codon:yes stop_codon:yes gene_type:complete